MGDEANTFFKAGDYVKAIAAYDAALDLKPPPADKDAAVAHCNAAQALLNLAAKDEERREACAAEALRRAHIAVELDPLYPKAHARCAAACDILGEMEAAADFRSRAENCSATKAAAESAEQAAKRAEADQRRKDFLLRRAVAEKAEREKKHRDEILARERALENEKDSAAEAASLTAMLGIPATIG